MNFKESFKMMAKNPLFVVSAILLDIVFFFGYGVIRRLFFDKIMKYAYAITTNISAKSGELMQSYAKSASIYATLLNNSEIGPYLKSLILLFIALGVCIYILYIILQGTSWWICSRIAKQEISYYQYIKGFLAVNILWVSAFYLINSVSFVMDINQAVLEGMAQYGGVAGQEHSTLLGIFMIIFYVAAFYFIMISYSYCTRKKAIRSTFLDGVTKAKSFIPSYIIVVFGFILISALLTLLEGFGIIYQFLFDIFVGLPFLVWARVFFISSISNAHME